MEANVVTRIIDCVGGVSALAKAVGVSAPSIIGWRRRNSIPSSRVIRVSEITGIPASELRPDLYRGLEQGIAS